MMTGLKGTDGSDAACREPAHESTHESAHESADASLEPARHGPSECEIAECDPSERQLPERELSERERLLVTPDGVSLLARRIAPLDEGAAGRSVYLAHGQAQHSGSLLATMRGFARAGWTAHAVDIRGHGRSTGARAPHAHMEPGAGWERAAADMRLALDHAFDGVAWEDRLVVASNIGASLVLEVMKDEPELARSIVFAAPPPNQPKLLALARAFVRARTLVHAADAPDEVLLHQLYTFLGGPIEGFERLIDVVSSDRALTDAMLADPLAWPTPTTGYFAEMFRGIASGWGTPADRSGMGRGTPAGMREGMQKGMREGTRALILYGGDAPVTANGRFVEPMRRHFGKLGIADVTARMVRGGRAALVMEEERLRISATVLDWYGTDGTGETAREVSGSGRVGGKAAVDSPEAEALTADILSRLGLTHMEDGLEPDALVELCYTAIDDESRWVEILYRVAYAAAGAEGLDEERIEAVVASLNPHWDRSMRINRQIMHSAAVGAVLENVIDRFDLGVALVDDALEIAYANDRFCRTIARVAGEGEGSDAPVDRDRAGAILRALADGAFREAAARGTGDALLMVDGEAVGFHFRPPSLRQTALRRGGASGVIVLRVEGGDEGEGEGGTADRGGRAELLQFAYALTAKEAEAVLLLLDGLSPDEIAARRGVSINTVRTHLGRIYRKIGVQGQTELATQLLKGPLGLVSS